MAGNTTCPGRRQLYTCDSSQARECCTMDPCSQPNCPSNELSERGNDSPPIASLSTRNLKNDDEQSYTPKDDPPKTEASQPSTSESPTEPAKTKSDSGITHTIPNSSIVTVTKHTVVFSEAPSPSKASISESSTLGDIPTSTCSTCNLPSNTTTPEQHEAGGGLPLGAIAGVATGGVIVLALVAIIWILYRRKRRGKGNSYLSNDGDVTATDGYEKMTPHTTGTESLDPFAPFGGRADQPHGPYPPPSGTFEMDSTPMAPVELPAISISEAPDNSVSSPGSIVSPETPVATDPRSNLGPSSFTQGRTGYVNQWNQYKAMAEDKSARSK